MYAIVAAPIGIPGCPEFAFCTASIESVRIVLMHSSSTTSDTRPGSCFASRDLLIGHLLSTTAATVGAGRHRSPAGRVVGACVTNVCRGPALAFVSRESLLSDERKRQFVSVKGVVEIRKRGHQQTGIRPAAVEA